MPELKMGLSHHTFLFKGAPKVLQMSTLVTGANMIHWGSGILGKNNTCQGAGISREKGLHMILPNRGNLARPPKFLRSHTPLPRQP